MRNIAKGKNCSLVFIPLLLREFASKAFKTSFMGTYLLGLLIFSLSGFSLGPVFES